MKVFQGSLLLALALCAGCSTVQSVTDAAASKYGGQTGTAAVRKFRQAEGERVGMIATEGKSVRRIAVNKDGIRHTDGVYFRVIVDEEVVPPDSNATGAAIPDIPAEATNAAPADQAPADPPPSGAGDDDAALDRAEGK